ncbi:CD5 antigen-like, partial [Boleophthalmus pectinirostris]|uniref:CD5 antigen-like n=1 Tax=Boleophthalmus pectinirostris TaxID=150288 RepID=UPI002433048D
MMVHIPGYQLTTELLHLKPNTSYEFSISARESGQSMSVTGFLTTPPDSVRLSGGPGRCSGSLEVHTDQLWSSVCAEGFGQTEAEIICRELDCGGVSDLQGALITEGSVVGRSFHCSGAEAALKDCESSETLCSAAANITCTDDVTLWLNGRLCHGFLHLRHQDEWRTVATSVQDLDLDFG